MNICILSCYNKMTNKLNGHWLAFSNSVPTHYTLKIQSYSALSIDKYESGVFQAGGYKWKLVLYPEGNKSKNVTDHLSLYIAMADTTSLRPGWELHVIVRFFLFNQNTDAYLSIPDSGKECRFHRMRLQGGYDEFISFASFKNVKNGYVIDDSCIFGAELFVSKESCTGRGECLSMIKTTSAVKHVWWIENMSKLNAGCNESNTFVAGGQRWKTNLYPKGKGMGSGTHISLYLALADVKTMDPGSKILADFTLRILDQRGRGYHLSGRANHWFSDTISENGWSMFVSVNHLSKAYVVEDICIVEAEVTVLGVSDVF